MAWGFYGELNGLYPTAAAVRRYMSRSMDDRVALTITFTYLSTIILVIAADAFIVGSAIAHVLGQPSWLVAIYIAAAARRWPPRPTSGAWSWPGAVQDIATFTVVVTTAVIGVLAIVHHPTAAAQLAAHHRHHGAGAFVQAVALGVFLYGGLRMGHDQRRGGPVTRAWCPRGC